MHFKWIKIGILAAMWLGNFVLSTGRYMSRPNPPDLLTVLRHDFEHWLVMIFIIPLVLIVSRKFRIKKGRIATSIVAYVVTSLVFTVVYVGIVSCAAYGVLPGSGQFFGRFQSELLRTAYYPQGVFWTFLSISLILDYFKKNRDRELWASDLETKLAHARLEALTMQIQPHFLFNTLNTISSLIREKNDRGAINILSKLGDLLRSSFENPSRQEVRLSEELDFLDNYLEIEKERFHDRLRVNMHVDDSALNAIVPSLILQPLVENAIKHGISKSIGARDINISASTSNGHLQLTVENDGPQLPNSFGNTTNNGIGLANTVKRLKHLYGENHKFIVERKEGGGAIASLEIPFNNRRTIDES